MAGNLWRRWSLGPLVLALIALSLSSTQGDFAPENVHGAVFSWAESNPGEPVPVIVRSNGGDPAAAVRAAGGTVERDLAMIGAIDALVPAEGIDDLAGSSAVAFISLDAPVVSTGFIDPSAIASAYPFAVNAPAVWTGSTPRTGHGVGIAIIDTGISESGNPDFEDDSGASRVAAQVSISSQSTNVDDGYGHGTHVAGIAGGDGDLLAGRYVGIAPGASIIDVKIANDSGGATLADAIAGIQWAVDNKDLYNIRVINLSLHSSVAESYRTSALDAAVEFAWMRGIVVVVSSGNMGTASDAVSYPPANDPFVIVVGATDDMGTHSRDDDVVAFFSSRGVTQDGFAKPDVVAPGRKIVSDIDPASVLAQTYPDRFVDQYYFRMSGTSMAAPVVSGIVALMLEQNPLLSPGEVKYVLTRTSEQLASDSSAKTVLADAATFYSGSMDNTDRQLSPGRQVRMNFTAKLGAIAFVLGQPDPQAAAAAVGFEFDRLGPAGTNLDNVRWESIKWSAIKWDSIKWDAIKWDAIKWDAIKWDAITWDAIKWDAVRWGAVKWDAITWGAITWGAIKWDAIKWDAVTSTDTSLTGLEFGSGEFDSAVGMDGAAFDTYLDDPALDRCHDRGGHCDRRGGSNRNGR